MEIAHAQPGQLMEERFNELADRINALMKLSIVPNWFGHVLMTEANAKIVLDPDQIGSGGGAIATTFSFTVTPSKFTGTGDVPTDQLRRVRVEKGFVGTKQPENNDDEFTIPSADGVYLVVIIGECHSGGDNDGQLISCFIDVATSVAGDPTGEPNFAPATWSRALAFVTIKDGRIKLPIVQCWGSSLDMAPVIVGVDCGTVTKQYFVGRQFKDIIELLDATETPPEDNDDDDEEDP